MHISLEEYKASSNPGQRQVAADWQKHSARLKDLYQEAEADLRLNLEGKKDQKELMSRWMSGLTSVSGSLFRD